MLKPRVGIALGGGGSKGLTHIGVLKALESMGLKFSAIVGTSIGAIIGGLYSLHGTTESLKEKAAEAISSNDFQSLGLNAFAKKDGIFHKLVEKYYMGKLLFKESHLDTEKTERIFRKLFKDATFEQVKIPFAAVALDLTTGEDYIFDHGPLMIGTWASSAIPGIFPPVSYDDHLLIDGGITVDLPAKICRKFNVNIVIGVYLGDSIMQQGVYKTGFQILKRSVDILNFRMNEPNLIDCDVLIHPHLDHIHWADFSKIDECIEEGKNAVLRREKDIREAISFPNQIKKLFRFRR